MAIGLTEQAEPGTTVMLATLRKPWAAVRKSRKWIKAKKHRRERARAKVDPECMAQYRRYHGWEW